MIIYLLQKQFLAGAEAYAIETQLSKRVNEWQSKIEPLLENENNHPEFNIQNYGELICEKLKNINKKEKEIEFNKLITNEETYEICRKFLSVLMMANENKIEIETDNEGNVDNSFKIKYIDVQ